ncbi:MAG TPA: hypothetical protein VHY84_28720 [Bryobacteraceae bacterium]|jgi:hypothetical protein|nr:hypothetical protein [Bryobacteraceae bacterium]
MKENQVVRPSEDDGRLRDLDELRRAVAALEGLNNAVGNVNPRHPGWHNDLIQLIKRSIARALGWYTRPQHEFNAAVSRSLKEAVSALDRVSLGTLAPDGQLARRPGKRSVTLIESIEEELEILQDQIKALVSLQKIASLEAPSAGRDADPGHARGNGRTAYVIGLFGTGRRYINELITQNLGERAKYFRDTIRLHSGPTLLIYSGHATIRHPSSFLQYPPEVTSRILEAVGSGFADLIFVYRHPLDSLLTNWIWWQTYLRENRMIAGISQVFNNSDDLCDYLEQNFFEFEAFAEGDPNYYAAVPGPRFLSFPEFVEETELLRKSATLALRLEDFMIDPLREFSRIAQVMSVDLDLSRSSPARPRTSPYGHLTVKDKVPRFRNFIDQLNTETKARIEKIGYQI